MSIIIISIVDKSLFFSLQTLYQTYIGVLYCVSIIGKALWAICHMAFQWKKEGFPSYFHRVYHSGNFLLLVASYCIIWKNAIRYFERHTPHMVLNKKNKNIIFMQKVFWVCCDYVELKFFKLILAGPSPFGSCVCQNPKFES